VTRRAVHPYLLLAALAWGCDGVTGSNEPALSLSNVAYGPDPAQVMDVALPAGRDGRTSVVVLIHGGGWLGGDKSIFTTANIKALTDQGYAVVNANYRLASLATNVHDPLLSDDITAVLDHVDEHAEEYRTAAGRFGLIGHSAGGHLALLAAFKYNATRRIKAVASMAGPTDLNDPLFLAIPTVRLLIENYLGVTQVLEPARWTGASPVSVVTSQAPPTILLQGMLDPLVPFSQAGSLHERLLELGVTEQYRLFPLLSHDVGYAFPAGFPEEVWGPIRDWFNRYLR